MHIRILAVLVLLSIVACHSTKKPLPVTSGINFQAKDSASREFEFKNYNASRKRTHDLIHTKLDVHLDWVRSEISAKATLTLKPYFYTSSILTLDAKGFDIREVSLLKGTAKSKLDYLYDKKAITINLDKEYSRKDTFTVYIEYTARPDSLPVQGSAAITESKGLYFINANGKDKETPTQLWSQGETESSSCWFPTIDAPNERMTQEIFLTVDTSFVTLSNGLMEFSQMNGDGTRTDYWKQSLAAAPYLTMIAVGEFSVVKDKWRDIEVNYYVEPEYEKNARMIFGHTPEMLEYFSTRLGVNYPWEKFSQIVVRDYVSGAMENTTAVVHGEFIQRNEREYLDETYEDVISHELFHHWFGDLVTCESWSNLPLNESFATYGEYLWNEKKYGNDAADYGLQADLATYLQQSKVNDHELIWFYHKDKEDMFDGISYQKGSRILHMLRNYVGDEAFFTALKNYLSTHKFSSVEFTDLRLAFEQVTGEDLNWFFNQWFLRAGHPDLDISYLYNDSLKKQVVKIKQIQEADGGSIKSKTYKIPMAVDIYANGKVVRNHIVLEREDEEFLFNVASKPDLVNVDADKVLLCTRKDSKPASEWAYQYYHAPKYLDRFEAVRKLGEFAATDTIAEKAVTDALNDSFWNIRALAIKNTSAIRQSSRGGIMSKLLSMVEKDPKSLVRAVAIDYLAKDFEDTTLIAVYKKALGDSAYSVSGAALEALALRQPAEGIVLAKSFEKEKNQTMMLAVAQIYAKYGKDEQNAFFEMAFEKAKGTNKYFIMQSYGNFLLKTKDETISKGLVLMEDMARNGAQWWIRLSALQAISGIYNMYEVREKEQQDKLDEFIKQAKQPSEIKTLDVELKQTQKQKALLKDKVDILKALELEKSKSER